MTTPDPSPDDWAASALSEEGQADLRILNEFGGGPFNVEAGHAAFEERIAQAQPSSAARSVLVGALVLAGLGTLGGFAVFRTDATSPPPVAQVQLATTPANANANASANDSTAETPSIPSVSVDALPSVATAHTRPVPVPVPAPAPAAAPGGTTTTVTSPAADPPDLIEAEVRHASTLRVVARTDSEQALTLAAEGDRLFPRGLLHAEREAIAIEALARLDRSRDAKTRAEAFMSAYPSHPRAARIRAIAKGERPWEH